VSQSSEFCRYNPLCCFSTSVYCCKLIFRYRLSPDTFGYTLVSSNGRTLSNTVTNLSVSCQVWNSFASSAFHGFSSGTVLHGAS